MNFKDLLNKLGQINEAETRKVKGKAYGGSAQVDPEEDDEDSGKKKPAAKKTPGKRGRPKKGADAEGNVPQYKNAAGLQSYIVGNLPKEKPGKVSKKHSLKEADQVTIQPADQKTQVIKQGNKTLGTVDNPALANQIKSSLGKGEMSLTGDELGEAELGISSTTVDKLISGVDSSYYPNPDRNKYNIPPGTSSISTSFARFSEIAPKLMAGARKGFWEVDKEDDFPRGIYTHFTVTDPKNFGLFLDAIYEVNPKHPINLSGSQGIAEATCVMGRIGNDPSMIRYPKGVPKFEKHDTERYFPESKEAKPDFLDVDKDGNKKEPIKKALKQKTSSKKISEGISLRENRDAMEHIISKFKHEVKNFLSGDELDSDLYDALFDYYLDQGNIPYGVAKARTGDPFEWVSNKFREDVYDFIDDEDSLEEGAREEDIPAVLRKGSKGKYDFPMTLDRVNAPGDRISDIRNIHAMSKKMDDEDFLGFGKQPDAQFESWEKELNTLLNEGLTVSFNSGQQNTPDNVSINATEEDAGELLSLLRNSGLGIFGKEGEVSTDHDDVPSDDLSGDANMLLSVNPEDEGEADSPEVVGDADDMMSLLKKMSSIGGEEEEEFDFSDEEDEEDDEEGLEEDSEEESSEESSEEDDEEEEEEEEEEGLEEGAGTCNECGMMEAECQCESEPVEENFQNEVDTEIADENYMMNTISGGLNKSKMQHKHGYRQGDNPLSMESLIKLAGLKR